MRLTLITVVVLALTVASAAMNLGEMTTKLGAFAVIVLVAVRVLIWLAGDNLYGTPTAGKSANEAGGGLANAKVVETD